MSAADTEADVAVIGAGPAGIAAVAALADAGVRTVLIDMNAQLGGQFWRHPDEGALSGFARPESDGHHHWAAFTRARGRIRQGVSSGVVEYHPFTQVWAIEAPGVQGSGDTAFAVHVTSTSGPTEGAGPASAAGVTCVRARRLLLATGGYDRQLPFPGWTLPGVMAAGGVQALLKGHQVVAGTRVAVGGTGPFLLPVAAGLVRAGATVVAVCEANSPLLWARRPVDAVRVPGKAAELVEYAAEFVRHRVPYVPRTVITRAHGDDRVDGVTVSRVDARGRVVEGSQRRLDVDLVATGWGFTPSMELPLSLGVPTRVDVDGSLVAEVDDSQRTAVPGVWCAGEITGVAGATESLDEGALAALSIIGHVRAGAAGAPRSDRLDDTAGRAGRARHLRAAITRGRAFARALHAASPVPEQWASWLDQETLICRCEEVSLGEVCRTADRLDVDDARGLRVSARPGMGWCQGRVCGYATAALAASLSQRPVTSADLQSVGRRPLATPVTLAELASGAGPS